MITTLNNTAWQIPSAPSDSAPFFWPESDGEAEALAELPEETETAPVTEADVVGLD